MQIDRLVDISRMAEILKVPKGWIYQRTQFGKGAIPFIKVGKYLRFDPDEVIDFFKNRDSRGGKPNL